MDYQDRNCYKMFFRNYELAMELFQAKKSYCWVVTISYYAALMLARTVFEERSCELPQKHMSDYRQGIVGWNEAIKNKIDVGAGQKFEALYRASRRFRYDPAEALVLTENSTRQYLQIFADYKKILAQSLKLK